MMIEINGLSFSYGEEAVINNLTFKVPDTGITAIVAPSGKGKTTMLRLIAGLEKIQGGSITGVPDKISYVFQENRLLPWLPVLENVAVVNEQSIGKNGKFENREKLLLSAKILLKQLGINEELQLKLPAELSGGQKQRACLARALFYCGDLLLLDEPFNGLDHDNRESALFLIKEYAKGKPVILVSHLENDIDVADKVINLN